MKITCYRCDKKYSDKFDRCPRCYKVEKDKSNKGVLVKLKKIFEKLISDIQLKDRDVYDNVNKRSALFFMEKKKYCKFCGAVINATDSICPVCFGYSGISEKKENISEPTKLYEILDEVIQEKFKAKDSKVSFDKLNEVFEKNNYDLKNWLSTRINFSKKQNTLIAITIYLSIIIVTLLKYVREGGAALIILLTFVAVIGTFLIPVVSKSLNLTGLFMDVDGEIEYIVSGRDNTKIYMTNTNSVESINLEINEELKVSKIIINSDPKSRVNSPIFRLDVSEFWNTRELAYFTILFCLKADIELNIKLAENIENEIIQSEENLDEINIEDKKSELLVFVRIDKKIEGKRLNEDDLKLHFEYLTKISNEVELTGGGFKDKDSGMIIFRAKDFEEATKIAENDPIILLKYYTYELFQWDIKINTEQNKS